jgi:hypothetical protein
VPVRFFDTYFWPIIVVGMIVIVALIGLILFLRNQQED